MLNIEKEIELINDIIANAVKHGADSGGSYESNEENLEESIKNWISEKGLSDDYTVERIPIEDGNIYGWWIHQIVKR